MTHPPPGTPWPGGQHGEVFSPSGQRAYLAAEAAALAGRSVRWASDLAHADNMVHSEQGHAVGRRGRPAWFLIADSFENYLQARGKWPPPQEPTAQADWQHLLALQGADLDAQLSANAELRTENEQLKALLRQRDDHIAQLAQMVAQLAKTPH